MTPTKPRPDRLLVYGLWLAAVLVLGYLVSLYGVYRVSREDQRAPADAIVVLGAAQYNGKPSPVLRARLDHALALFREGLAPAIVVTGGIGDGDRVSEATVGRQYLVINGIPDSAVIVRPEGRSTQVSIRSVALWAQEHGAKRVLLVSDPFHMLRLRLETRHAGLEPLTSPTATSPISANRRQELLFLSAEAFKIPLVLLHLW